MSKETEEIRICADPQSKEGDLAALVTTTREEKITIGSPEGILHTMIALDEAQRIVKGAAQNNFPTWNGKVWSVG